MLTEAFGPGAPIGKNGIEKLERLPKEPGKLSPLFFQDRAKNSALRSHPRFQALLEKYDTEH